MEASSDTIPSHTASLSGSQPFYSSSQTSNGHVLLPLSPLSFPQSPTALERSARSSPLSNSSSRCSDEHSAHCRSSTPASDQDDLTCLSWLHQRGSSLLPLQPLPKINLLSKQQPEPPRAFATADSLSPSSSSSSSSNKPPYSFSSLIFMAIEDSPDKLLPVKGIYEWIVNSFPYYGTAAAGWRNSVRHNLSLSKSFQRIQRDKSQSVGKGSLWCVCPEYRAALLEVLKKTHHYHSANSNLVSMPALLDGADYGTSMVCDSVDISDSLSHSLLLSTPSSHILTSDNPTLFENSSGGLTPDHEELVTMESVEEEEEEEGEGEEEGEEEEEEAGGGEMEKDPLSDSGYIELHYYQCHQYQYLVLPGEAELDLESVEILQLDAEAQEAAGSLLDLAGGWHPCL